MLWKHIKVFIVMSVPYTASVARDLENTTWQGSERLTARYDNPQLVEDYEQHSTTSCWDWTGKLRHLRHTRDGHKIIYNINTMYRNTFTSSMQRTSNVKP